MWRRTRASRTDARGPSRSCAATRSRARSAAACAGCCATSATPALPSCRCPTGGAPTWSACRTSGDLWIVEVKSSVEDFRTDHKWPEYRDFSDALFFAVAPAFPVELLPADTGLILADRYGGEIVRAGARDAARAGPPQGHDAALCALRGAHAAGRARPGLEDFLITRLSRGRINAERAWILCARGSGSMGKKKHDDDDDDELADDARDVCRCARARAREPMSRRRAAASCPRSASAT